MIRTVNVGSGKVSTVTIANDKPFALICGPCAIESRDMALATARDIRIIAEKVGVPVIYKSSFDKANRTSLKGARGIGMDEGLKILSEVRTEIGLPVLTDIHEIEQVEPVAEVVDVLQIPAFLCRQTDLVLAAAASGKPLNIKKGQFLAPWDMQNIVDKVTSTNNHNLLLCERGVSFGYNNLVSDMRSLRIMAQTGYPVVMDATHSVQMPGGQGTSSGGKREFVEPLARAAVAIGVAAVFIESHPKPETAPSDGPNMVPMPQLEGLLRTLKVLDGIAKATPYQAIA
jgi:2-dehydro-3-deoxyphosphooctonate aldolase (KDO 8-P synthase)